MRVSDPMTKRATKSEKESRVDQVINALESGMLRSQIVEKYAPVWKKSKSQTRRIVADAIQDHRASITAESLEAEEVSHLLVLENMAIKAMGEGNYKDAASILVKLGDRSSKIRSQISACQEIEDEAQSMVDHVAQYLRENK